MRALLLEDAIKEKNQAARLRDWKSFEKWTFIVREMEKQAVEHLKKEHEAHEAYVRQVLIPRSYKII